MSLGCKYGTHRTIEPKNILPQPAWKIDNYMEIYDNEMLVDVHTLNINSASFAQICTECQRDTEKITQKILRIVEMRGKLHNPVTGTGGMFAGRVKRIGCLYPKHDLRAGDEIASLVSLSLTPLKIKKIKEINKNCGQIDMEGEAILFESSPLIRIPHDLSFKQVMAVLDEAGAPIQTWNLTKPKDTVLILGAIGKIGLLCAFAARDKIGKSGRIIGTVRNKRSEAMLKKTGIFDEVICIDALKPVEAAKILAKNKVLADVTINGINIPGTETLSVLATKDGGKLYFASLASNYNIASLTAEGIGKDINILVYKGYTKKHGEFAIHLLRKHAMLRELLEIKLEKDQEEYLKKIEQHERLEIGKADASQLGFLKGVNLEDCVFVSREMQNVLRNALQVANYDCTVLINGESGVGKEVLAQIIHNASRRSNSSLIKINCGSIPQNLLEAEMFGYEEGAFTGAKKNGKLGIFEVAQGGTLFLDEIGEMPLNLQVKLLRALQEKEIYRVGGIKPIKVDTRIIAATNKNLKHMVEQGNFREDLFYRLNVFPILIPPLRARRQDIIPLAKFFLEKYNQNFKMEKKLSLSALQCLVEYDWPGNIREMENLIQRLLISCTNELITDVEVMINLEGGEQIQEACFNHEAEIPLKGVVEKAEYQVLKIIQSKHKTTREMAKALGISQATLIRRLKKYGLS